jgi:hypothetical protein
MANDDIRELLGRYAIGPLTEEERERLFDAALSDQDLFEELAREQELKMLLEEPGARDRMLRALDAPNRWAPWILSAGVLAALSVVLIAFLLRPTPKSRQVAVTKAPTPASLAPVEVAKSEPPRPAPAVKKAAKPEPPANQREAVAEPAKDTREAVVDLKQAVQVQAADTAVAAQQYTPQQQSPSGPRQMAAQSRAAGAARLSTPVFGFHYSVETKGHLIVVPGADGYLSVTGSDGTTLFRKQIAAAITTDIPLPDSANSLKITFSPNSSPVETAPTARTATEGDVIGNGGLAIEIKVK